jgi:hypothetical protein
MQTPNQQEMEAFLRGKPVSPEFLAELESRTSNLLTQLKEAWNPDTAGEEMAALFAEADRIMQQPHYQEANADEVQNPSAGSLPTTDKKQSLRTNQS